MRNKSEWSFYSMRCCKSCTWARPSCHIWRLSSKRKMWKRWLAHFGRWWSKVSDIHFDFQLVHIESNLSFPTCVGFKDGDPKRKCCINVPTAQLICWPSGHHCWCKFSFDRQWFWRPSHRCWWISDEDTLRLSNGTVFTFWSKWMETGDRLRGWNRKSIHHSSTRFRTPYNRFSGGGFIVFLIHQSLNQYALFGTQNCCLSIFIGLCFFLDALCTDFRLHFEEMDRLSAKNDSQSKHKLKSMVLDAIKFQQRIIELSTSNTHTQIRHNQSTPSWTEK